MQQLFGLVKKTLRSTSSDMTKSGKNTRGQNAIPCLLNVLSQQERHEFWLNIREKNAETVLS